MSSSTQIKSRGVTQTFEKARDGEHDVTVTKLGFRMVGETLDMERPPPELGQDGDDILRTLGFEDAEIAKLRNAGTI